MELFLTSSIHAVAHDIAKKINLSKLNKLVFINTAAELKEGDMTWLKNDRQSLVDAGFDVADYTITSKTGEQIEKDLDEYSFIYLSGGDTAYLLQQSQRTGFVSVIREFVQNKGKVYVGTSAGSIITGPRLPDYFPKEGLELKNDNGYGFVNFTLLPHWGSEKFKDRYLGGRMEIAYKEDQVPLLLLTDNQYVHVQDDQMKIIDVKKIP